MSRSLQILVVGTLIAAASTGVALGKGEPDPQRSASGTDHASPVALDRTSPAPATAPATPVGQTGAGAPVGSAPAGGGAPGKSSGRGANVTGPYDPFGVGEPSGNGKSESNNGKRPCAGCVGKADAKNPRGQLPGGNDANRGYECDENQGVGKTNPAHSGCRPPVTLLLRPPTTVPPLITPAVVAGTPALVPASNQVLGDRGASPKEVAEAEEERQGRSPQVARGPGARELAFTGLGLAWMALLGVGFVALGRGLRRQGTAVGAG